MEDYIHALNIMIRRGLYFAQINKDPEFTINNLIHALSDLIAFKIYSDEIKSMKEEVIEILDGVKSQSNTFIKRNK